jgi:peptidoglycan/LPS O-acetylase OafA/YrhL
MGHPQSKIFFPNLDGLRFVAFFGVFFTHTFIPECFDSTESSHLYFFLTAQRTNGSLGVNLFFVLSGFLITYLLINEKEKRTKINVPNFYMRRILRIWPLYFLMVALGFFIYPIIKKIGHITAVETATLPYYIFFISNFQLIQKGFADCPILNPLWSVGVEEQFYAIWPLILAFMPRKYLIKVFSLIILLTLVFRYFNVDSFNTIRFHTFSVFGDMVMGGLAAYLCFYNTAFKKFITGLPRKTIVLTYVVGFFLILFDYKIFAAPALLVIERFVFSLFFAFVIVEQNLSINSFYKISNNKFLSKWGNYTYGLYCLHTTAMFITNLVAKRILKNDNQLLIMILDYIIGLPLVMILAYLSYSFFEAPFLKLKNKFAYFIK